MVHGLACIYAYMYFTRMPNKVASLPLAVIRHRIKAHAITQELLAKKVGASQSQVSRVLAGHSKVRSRLLEKICVYVENIDHGVTPERVRGNADLVTALAEVWDGSHDHAQALCAVIRSLGLLAPARSQPRGVPHDPA